MGSLSSEGDDEPPDYSSSEYLPYVYELANKVDIALLKNKIKEFSPLLEELHEAEGKLPLVIADRSAVRMIEGRIYSIQERLIKGLRLEAA